MAKKISELPIVTAVTNTSEMELNEDGVSKKITMLDLFNFFNASSTSWLKGGEITIDAGNTTVSYASGVGTIVDATDTTNMIPKKVEWSGVSGVTPDFLATDGFTFFAIDSNGLLVQSDIFPVGGSLRTHIQIGGVSHGNNTIVDAYSNFTSATSYQLAATITDFMIAIGVINRSGNVFAGSINGNLAFSKSAGEIFYAGISSKETPLTPNTKILPAEDSMTVLFSWRDGAGGFKTTTGTTITAGVYDDDSTGTTTAPIGTVTVNSWVNCRIKYSPDLKREVVEYGTRTYNSSANAVAGLTTDSFDNNHPQFVGVPIRGYLSLRGGATNMLDSGDAVFTDTNKFGLL